MIEPISNIKIYGLEDSIRRSKYPKSVNIESLNNNITETVRKLAKSRKNASKGGRKHSANTVKLAKEIYNNRWLTIALAGRGKQDHEEELQYIA